MSDKWNRDEPPFSCAVKSVNHFNLTIIDCRNCCISPYSNSKLVRPSFSPFAYFRACICRVYCYLSNHMLQKEPTCVSLLQVVWIHFEPSFNRNQILPSIHHNRWIIKRLFSNELPAIKQSSLERNIKRVIIIKTCDSSSCDNLTYKHLLSRICIDVVNSLSMNSKGFHVPNYLDVSIKAISIKGELACLTHWVMTKLNCILMRTYSVIVRVDRV